MTEEQNSRTPKIRKVRVWPDPVLHHPAVNVFKFDQNLRDLVDDMFMTMTAYQGVGLSGPQIGISKNIITIRIEPKVLLTLINPRIVEQSEEMFQWEEGCLSVPGYFEDRERPKTIVLKFKDVDGNEHEAEFSDLYAFAIQHEMDHLRGKVFVDDISFFKKSRVKKKIKKQLPDVNAQVQYAEIHLDQIWNEMKDNKEENQDD